MPTLHVVAGPNGCGKSTLTRTTWFRGVEVVDPDMLTRDMTAGYPAWAAREALQRRQAALAAGRTLALETTLAGAGVLRFMEVARQAGHWIVLHFISVNSAEQALLRIRNRVALGGHDVPEADVRRRFARSHANLPVAIMRADEAVLYDNTDPAVPHREVALLREGAWWSGERLPIWAAAAIARVTAPSP